MVENVNADTEKYDLAQKMCAEEKQMNIRKQVEYYFGDFNLANNKNFEELITVNNGWISVDTLLNMKRMRQLTRDPAAVISAVKDSDLVEVDEKLYSIRRAPSKPVPEVSQKYEDELKDRTVYAKGFPVNVTLDDVLKFFDKFGKMEHVAMCRETSEAFKGSSCFAIFASSDNMRNFLKASLVKYDEEWDIIRFSKDEYLKKEDEKRQKQAEEEEEERRMKEAQTREFARERMTIGTILEVDGLSKDEILNSDDIKTTFLRFGKVKWIDYKHGESKFMVRFKSEYEAATAVAKMRKENEGKTVFGGTEVMCRVLEGDEELKEWIKIIKNKREKPNNRVQDVGTVTNLGPSFKKMKSAQGEEESSEDDNSSV